ncbi:MAG: hypothetical protein EHM67_00005 [Hyphomicrobiaceae bacterium]|nr:MAG: hypothetical protein EHM67_00005 [Hyphomicrobiaceae bacterium]
MFPLPYLSAMTFMVQLIPQGRGRWAALLADPSSNEYRLISTEIRRPRTEIAQLLLRQGHDPRIELVIRQGAKVIASDLLGCVVDRSVCSDLGVIERG